MQENTGEVYIFEYCIYIFEYLSSIMCTHDIYLFFFLYVAIWIDDHNGENKKYSRPNICLIVCLLAKLSPIYIYIDSS